MRTIKFRGLRIGLEGFAYGLPDYYEMYDEWGIGDYAVDEDTIDQFTGLYDKNGNEIYEGDIVEINTKGIISKEAKRILVVEWYQEECKYVLSDENSDDYGCDELTSLFIKRKNLKVIGNIHDNPKLFKQ
jgi:hypothetical protein|nr:MAG TPA: YopX protein [Caudoviricetes sp.]